MIDVLYEWKAAGTPERPSGDRGFHARIRAEFHEMPGMRLTLAQASRLFGLEPTCCARVLGGLVADGVLRTDGREFLGRNTGRRFASP